MKRNQIAIAMVVSVFAVQSCSTDDLAALNNLDASAVNYTDHIMPLVKSYCIGCHQGESPAAGVNLETYENVKKHMVEGNLHTRINDGKDPMPPGELMPPSYRELFMNWSDNQFKAR